MIKTIIFGFGCMMIGAVIGFAAAALLNTASKADEVQKSNTNKDNKLEV